MSRTRRATSDRSRGAAAVEFALVLPILVALLFGIIEFGWMFGQQLDIKHGTREAARIATVNYRPVGTTEDNVSGDLQTKLIVKEVCERMNFSTDVNVILTLPTGSVGETGQLIEVTVNAPVETITGMFDNILGAKTATSHISARVEVEVSWNPTTSSGLTCASVTNVTPPAT